jgi:cytochrome c oxidase accessory protein FixG
MRRWVGYALIAFFVALPLIPINGHPAVLLNVADREFHLFGATFLPTDTRFLALFMLSVFLTVFLFTSLLGRVWCGWGCPQTVYLEFVFRPIERLWLGVSGKGGRPKVNTAWRRAGMYLTYIALCFALAHVFLAYFVGWADLKHWMFQSPWEHPWPFVVMGIVTVAMFFDFAYWREQMCIIGCPYGRFQSVLLDRDSLIVSYDAKRGEPRGKAKRSAQASPTPEGIALRILPDSARPLVATKASSRGDCIDCTMCVQVCPTGIDIRDGLQIECVNCTQCIDACDSIMDKVGKPRGLIRYSSQRVLDGQPRRIVRPRVLIYATALCFVVALLSFMLATRASLDMVVMRGAATPSIVLDDGSVQNTLRVRLANRLETERKVRIEAILADASHAFAAGESIAIYPSEFTLKPGETRMESLRVVAPSNVFTSQRARVSVRAIEGDETLRMRTFVLLGPAR